jgi:hypothetical protein
LSDDASGNGLDVTFREFVAGQKLFNRYTLIKTLGGGGIARLEPRSLLALGLFRDRLFLCFLRGHRATL